MRITAHTPLGSFAGKNADCTNAEVEDIKRLLQNTATNGTHLTLDTETGFIVLGAEILRQTLFVFDSNKG